MTPIETLLVYCGLAFLFGGASLWHPWLKRQLAYVAVAFVRAFAWLFVLLVYCATQGSRL